MLLDTNIVIYACQSGGEVLTPWTSRPDAAVASIVWIEALGFAGINPAEEKAIRGFLEQVVTYALEEEVIGRAIQLRQQTKIKLGDAIMAATALEYGVPLVTRNDGDFRKIAGLDVRNPYSEGFQ